MAQEIEYLLMKDKGPYHEVYVRRPLNPDPGACRFYTIVIAVIAVCLVLLTSSLVYVFVLIPSAAWQGEVLNWDGRGYQESRTHVLTHTHCGPVEGLWDEEAEVYVFKGLPYAQPPTGELRWERPRPLSARDGTCWRSTRPAKDFAQPCLQPGGPRGDSGAQAVGSEDCLYLNVWTRTLDPLAGLPVMVWLHGGGLLAGSGHAPAWSPTEEAAAAGRVVFVSLNYRLGPLGFLALDELARGSSTGTSGNYGLMDVILALQWVQDNIRNFGGNPQKVTVFGQGSGATLIHALLASPSARGLFHRAWLSSPSLLHNKTSTQASLDNRPFLNATGCREAACLRGLTAQQVMSATSWTDNPYWARGDHFSMPSPGRVDGALLVVDGFVLPEAPLRAWNSGRGNDVPLLFTTLAQEADLTPDDPNMAAWTWAHYEAAVKQQLTPFSRELAAMALMLYPPGEVYTPEYQYTSLLTDLRLTCPVQALANVTSALFRSPVYRAVVTSAPSRPVNVTGFPARYAFHGWDLLSFFGDFRRLSYRPSAQDLAFQKVLREQVLAFARDGRPAAPVWDTARACVVLLSDHVFPLEQYNRNRCDFWLRNGFLSYAGLK